jgi:hypothetical protein
VSGATVVLVDSVVMVSKDVAKVVKKLSSGKILRASSVHVAEKALLLPSAKIGCSSEMLK